VLSDTRQRGHAVEDGEVTPGFASVAAAVLDHNDLPLAGIAVTYPTDQPVDLDRIVPRVIATARAISRRVGGHG
jgi:DNA-binding IclR family transcriptional regulator